jgi:hypothetical protein
MYTSLIRSLEGSMIGIGDRVLHRKYGSGTVLAVEDDLILTIRFDDAKACCRIVRSFVIRWGEAEGAP